MTPLEAVLVERIAAEGPLTFAAFMEAALYDPEHGYYASGRVRTGWDGDFVTSPELDPAYGALWARWLDRMWRDLGRPDPFVVVEIGPGEAGWARAVLDDAGPELGGSLSLVLVEAAERVRSRQRALLVPHARHVRWVEAIDAIAPFDAGVVFANEVLDVLPVHLVTRKDGEIAELLVGRAGDDFELVPGPPPGPDVSAILASTGTPVREGEVREVPVAATRLILHSGGLFERGALVLVDYGHDAHAVAQRQGGTLVSYGDGTVSVDVLDAPGTRDITAHVNWDAIAAACRAAGLETSGPRPQRDVLTELGVADLDRGLRAAHDAAVAAGDGAAAIRALSRRSALGVLTDPGGLGGLGVLIAARAVNA